MRIGSKGKKRELPLERFDVSLYDADCPKCGRPIYGHSSQRGYGEWGESTYVVGNPGREEMDIHCKHCGYDYRASFRAAPYDDDGHTVYPEYIRTTKNGGWAFEKPQVWIDPDEGTVAAIQYTNPVYWMFSFLYADGHFGHGYTCPYDDKHPIPPAIRNIAEEELMAFAEREGLLTASSRNAPKGGKRR